MNGLLKNRIVLGKPLGISHSAPSAGAKNDKALQASFFWKNPLMLPGVYWPKKIFNPSIFLSMETVLS
jgi:hypothetical protein